MAEERDVRRIDVRKDVGSLLMLRSTVAPLFRKIARFDAPRVTVDFSGVEFMSRSFADEYLAAKAACQKRIEERNVPFEVMRMLDLVSSQLVAAPHRTSQIGYSLSRAKVVSL